VVVLPPPQRPDLASAEVEHELGVQDYLVALRADAPLANWWDALADTNGNYQQVLLYADLFGEPTLHTVREDDGVHLTEDGAQRTASWTATALRQFWPAPSVLTTVSRQSQVRDGSRRGSRCSR